MATPKATQSFVPVKEVRNGIILLKSDGYRGVLMCSSINFALKSEDEQKAVIGGFQTFLNTLDFSVEILVHSRKIDIRPYLDMLNQRMEAQTTELMRIQLREYIQFIRNFVEGSSIMTKLFYVIVPYSPAIATQVASSVPFLGGKRRETTGAPMDSFEENRAQLEQRMALVANGLQASGIRAVALGTEEVIELLYRSFNLGETESPIRFSDASASPAHS